ncbi:ultra-long-chain fatty acid omega-hydroxylase isoform X2 [Latimeria chalumnae]|uniref:ultra-long-chain fatty acid omega-hydroxylase isoform X2 n=1 Tax=Latimeria chalumnae TaxID=7897 RepID=UPI00313AFADA
MSFPFSAAAAIPLYPLISGLSAFLLFCLTLQLIKSAFCWRSKVQKLDEEFPGPPRHWLLGHLREFQANEYGLAKFLEALPNHPYCNPVFFGPFPFFINLVHPDYVRPVYNASAHVAPKMDKVYGFLRPWLGDGLLVANGNKWYRRRRLLTPSFHFDILKPYMKVYNTSAQIMLDKWEKLCQSGQSVELFEHVSLMTLDSLLKCAFSYNSNCQTRSFRKALSVLHTFTRSVIQKRKESLAHLGQPCHSKLSRCLESMSGRKYLDFLDMLLATKDDGGNGLTDEEIENEVDTFMFEGHDTTASGISWILYNLAKHPEHQDKCREEIQEVLQGRQEVEWDDLPKLEFTTMCIKESLRTHPPVTMTWRTLTKNVELPDGRTIPEGTHVSIGIFAVHHHPAVWEEPEVYNPYRFSPENVVGHSSHAFIPFAAGPRNCIGQNFAMNELKVVVALTLQRYCLIPDDTKPVERVPEVVMRSRNGVHLFLRHPAQARWS